MSDNNYYEWSERYLNSRASDDQIDVSNLDLQITPSWQGQHSFDGGVDITGANIRTGGSAITLKDSTNDSDILVANEGGPFDLSGAAQDLRLATNQGIEDGNGTKRFITDSLATRIFDEDGRETITLQGGNNYQLAARSSSPIVFRDVEGNFDAVQYTTSASAPGTLELTNANLDANNNDISNVGSLDTGEADVTNETFVRLSRASQSSSTSANTFINCYDTVNKDARGEASNGQIVPDESGEYVIQGNIILEGSTTASDLLAFRIVNVDDGTFPSNGTFNETINDVTPVVAFNLSVELTAGKTYELQITNRDNSFKVGTFGQGIVKRSVVHA
jgi:hypothetical protein